MRPIGRIALLAAPLLLAAARADGHTITPGTTGFTDGLQHPFLLPAHVMVLLGVGLLLGAQEIARWRIPLYAGLGGLLAGLAAGPLVTTPALEAALVIALLASAAVLGGLNALARPLPTVLLILVTTLPLAAIGLESAPEGSLQQVFAALAGSALAAIFALLNLMILANYARMNAGQSWQAIGLRVVGSWIAAAAILVLALQFRPV